MRPPHNGIHPRPTCTRCKASEPSKFYPHYIFLGRTTANSRSRTRTCLFSSMTCVSSSLPYMSFDGLVGWYPATRTARLPGIACRAGHSSREYQPKSTRTNPWRSSNPATRVRFQLAQMPLGKEDASEAMESSSVRSSEAMDSSLCARGRSSIPPV